MSKKNKQSLLPKLRFPEFQNMDEWSFKKLKDLIKLIEERAGTKKYTLMSVTAGLGLISQIEKFGREIAGNAYKNYYVIKKGDFAYNKSATKQFPEGYISMLTEYDEAALPNSIFICFRITDKDTCPKYFDHIFHVNYHGAWLRKFIAVGARAHGSLNVDTQNLLDMPFVLPSRKEQQKIADCLTSLDGLITAEAQKLEDLKVHKKGLMQQLFPAEGERVPKLRFPEFRDGGEWEEKKFGKILVINSGKGFKASEYSKMGVRLLQIENVGYGTTKWNENTIYLPDNYCHEYPELVLREGDIVLALNRPVTNDQLKITRINKNDEPAILYQRVGKFEFIDDHLVVDFVFQLSQNFVKDFVIKQSVGSDQPFISLRDLYAQKILIPSQEEEQQRIAGCLTSLDELINSQFQKIDALKAHKKGLMQQLFPSADEVDE